MGGDEICNNKYIGNVFGMSLNLFSKYYHAQCFFFEFSSLLIIDDLRLRIGWLKIEDWKMDEDGSTVGRR